jgi:hypothetical protein
MTGPCLSPGARPLGASLRPHERRRDELFLAEEGEAVGRGAGGENDVRVEDERQCPPRGRRTIVVQSGCGVPSGKLRHARKPAAARAPRPLRDRARRSDAPFPPSPRAASRSLYRTIRRIPAPRRSAPRKRKWQAAARHLAELATAGTIQTGLVRSPLTTDLSKSCRADELRARRSVNEDGRAAC